MNKYWNYDTETLIINHKAINAQVIMGKTIYPSNAILTEPLNQKEGYQVIAVYDEDGQPSGSEYIEDNRGLSIYDTTDCTNVKVMNSLGSIDQGWTLKKPKTNFDEWLDGKWITDIQKKYEYDYQVVNSTREHLYEQQVDRLNKEAQMIRRIDGDEEKASEYEAQADAAYLKIKEDNPWPENPNSNS